MASSVPVTKKLEGPMPILVSVGWGFVNLLQAIYLTSVCIFWITLALVVSLLLGQRAGLSLSPYWGRSVLFGAGARLSVSGLDNVDVSRPHVFMSNHQSMIDIPALFVAIPVNLRFIAKKELKYVPFIGWYVWAMGMIFINRKNRREAFRSIQAAAAKVRAGADVIAFPEGTRTRDGTIGSFKKGLFHLALQSGVPIVPVSIEGARDVVPTQTFKVRPGTIDVRLGKPIHTEGRSDSEVPALMAEVHRAIVELNVAAGGRGAAPDSRA